MAPQPSYCSARGPPSSSPTSSWCWMVGGEEWLLVVEGEETVLVVVREEHEEERPLQLIGSWTTTRPRARREDRPPRRQEATTSKS